VDDFTKAYQQMITVHGWNGTAATLGMKRPSLEARVYELNGNGLRVSTAMMIQRYSGTSHFAQAVAAATGGVYIDLPDAGPLDGADLLAKFHELYGEIGDLSKTYNAAIGDGEIDKRERAELERIGQAMHKTMKELMATMFKVYCRSADEVK
jgi:hypothetical protein